jgi:TolA-binding protein
MSNPSQAAPTVNYEALMAAEQAAEARMKKLLLIAGLGIAAVGGFGFLRYTQKQAEITAGQAYTAAKTVEDLDLVTSKNPSSLIAGNALLSKADLLWSQDKKAESIETLQKFTQDQSNHPLLPQALLALGSKLDAVGKRAEAKLPLERITTEFKKSPVALLADVRLADLLWAEGKIDEAKKIYESLSANHPEADKQYATLGEERLNLISAKLPEKEVDGPPKPKVTEPAPGAPQIQLDPNSPLTPTLSTPATSAGIPIQIKPGQPSTSIPIQVSPTPAIPAAPAPPAPSAKVEVQKN